MTTTPLELAVVIPTFNERPNLVPLLAALSKALPGIVYEVIFVDDDSPDGTAEAVRALALTNPRIRVLQRVGRRGLSSACLEGMMSTAAPYIAVMDADLQHDESVLPAMIQKLRSENLDIVIATRNASGGSMGDFSRRRVMISEFGRKLSRIVARCELSDPMSGFFVVTRSYLHRVVHAASGVGFKILLDLVASSPRQVRIGEVPYVFRKRIYGQSKLDVLVGLEYLYLLLDKSVGRVFPPRFVVFSMVGAVGVVVSAIMLHLLVHAFGFSIGMAQVLATLAAMCGNFVLNNVLTYRDRRLRGSAAIWGFFTFCAACSVGAVVNLNVAEFLRGAGVQWQFAGTVGLAIGAVWNFGVTSVLTWRARRNPRRTSEAARAAAAT